jgi:hypothetical protein
VTTRACCGPRVRQRRVEIKPGLYFHDPATHHRLHPPSDWKKKHVQDNKQYMLPGKGFAFQNNSEKHLRFELDFVDSENYEIIEVSPMCTMR